MKTSAKKKAPIKRKKPLFGKDGIMNDLTFAFGTHPYVADTSPVKLLVVFGQLSPGYWAH